MTTFSARPAPFASLYLSTHSVLSSSTRGTRMFMILPWHAPTNLPTYILDEWTLSLVLRMDNSFLSSLGYTLALLYSSLKSVGRSRPLISIGDTEQNSNKSVCAVFLMVATFSVYFYIMCQKERITALAAHFHTHRTYHYNSKYLFNNVIFRRHLFSVRKGLQNHSKNRFVSAVWLYQHSAQRCSRRTQGATSRKPPVGLTEKHLS